MTRAAQNGEQQRLAKRLRSQLKGSQVRLGSKGFEAGRAAVERDEGRASPDRPVLVHKHIAKLDTQTMRLARSSQKQDVNQRLLQLELKKSKHDYAKLRETLDMVQERQRASEAAVDTMHRALAKAATANKRHQAATQLRLPKPDPYDGPSNRLGFTTHPPRQSSYVETRNAELRKQHSQHYESL